MIRRNPKIDFYTSRTFKIGKPNSVIFSHLKNYYIPLISIILSITTTNFAQNQTNITLNIPGITVTRGESIKINSKSEIKTALAFQFLDASIVVDGSEGLIWSYDGGNAWVEKDSNAIVKVMIDLGNGEVLSVNRATHLKSNGKYSASINRSFDNWETVSREEAEVDIPHASYTTTGSDYLTA